MSNLPWFKLYTEARTDKKLSCLTLAERGVWINLLCYASAQPERGVFDASDPDVLALEVAEGDSAILESTIKKLLKVRHLCLYETSETSGNEDETTRNGIVTIGNSLQRYIFRTFAARQAQKVSNFPSDDKDKVNARVRKHRALKKQTQSSALDVKSVTSETRRNDTDRDIDREEENISLSGKVSNKLEDVGAPERAATAAAGASHTWSDAEAGKIARRLAGILHMVNPNLDGLMAVIKQYPNAQQWLEAQAVGCFEYYDEQRPRRKVNIRLFDNWLKRDENRRGSVTSSSSAQQPLTPEKVLSNGHTTPDAQPPSDPLYEFNVARARAKLVS